MNGHTPGPWRWEFYGRGDTWVRTSDGEPIVEIGHNQSARLENARLIALAPELVEALEDCIRLCIRVGDGANVHSPRAVVLYGRLHALLARLAS